MCFHIFDSVVRCSWCFHWCLIGLKIGYIWSYLGHSGLYWSKMKVLNLISQAILDCFVMINSYELVLSLRSSVFVTCEWLGHYSTPGPGLGTRTGYLDIFDRMQSCLFSVDCINLMCHVENFGFVMELWVVLVFS